MLKTPHAGWWRGPAVSDPAAPACSSLAASQQDPPGDDIYYDEVCICHEK